MCPGQRYIVGEGNPRPTEGLAPLSSIRPRLTYANVMATAAVLLALGGGAFATASFIGSDGEIHGCVDKKGHLTVLKPGRHCKQGQSKIAWNQQGPPGKNGRQGPKGDTGPATGAAGGDLTGTYPNPSIATGAVTQAKLAGAEGWHEIGTNGNPSFATNNLCPGPTHACFENYDALSYNAAGFFRDPYGIVHLKGLIKNIAGFDWNGGQGGSPIFVLPAGYRPARREVFAVDNNTAFGRIDVNASGNVFPTDQNIANAGWVSLDGITFRCSPSATDGCP